MTEFEDRMRRAVERGERRRSNRAAEARQAAETESELKNRHSRLRLQLSEHIEQTMKRLPDFLPGFRYELIYGERGWGAACSRDDLQIDAGGRQRKTLFSRLEITVRPYSQYHVLELIAKGTIRNSEVFNRTHFELLSEADPANFEELIDAWVVEFAELYSAKH